MREDPDLKTIKKAAKKILRKRLIDLTVEDVLNFLTDLEEYK